MIVNTAISIDKIMRMIHSENKSQSICLIDSARECLYCKSTVDYSEFLTNTMLSHVYIVYECMKYELHHVNNPQVVEELHIDTFVCIGNDTGRRVRVQNTFTAIVLNEASKSIDGFDCEVDFGILDNSPQYLHCPR